MNSKLKKVLSVIITLIVIFGIVVSAGFCEKPKKIIELRT